MLAPVRVNTLAPHYFDNRYAPGTVATLRVNEELIGFFELGMYRPRVLWLPFWLPFNKRWEETPEAQAECLSRLRKLGELLWMEMAA